MAKHQADDEDDKPEQEEKESASEDGDVPEGAAVFPEIPAELGVNPLLLAVVHARERLRQRDAVASGQFEETTLGPRQPVARRGIFLEKSVKSWSEIRQRRRLAVPDDGPDPSARSATYHR